MTREEVIADLTAYVVREYDGNWKEAFDANDLDRDGRISRAELINVLAKAGVGVGLTRRAIANRVVEEMDSNGDGFISFAEFLSAVEKQ